VFVVKQNHESALPKIVINPEWSPNQSDTSEKNDHEGCLSIPEVVFTTVVRKNVIDLRYQDMDGNVKMLELHGISARIVQHECDHLNGQLIVDIIPKEISIRIRADAIRNRKSGK
jgi:peptide deformylase